MFQTTRFSRIGQCERLFWLVVVHGSVDHEASESPHCLRHYSLLQFHPRHCRACSVDVQMNRQDPWRQDQIEGARSRRAQWHSGARTSKLCDLVVREVVRIVSLYPLGRHAGPGVVPQQSSHSVGTEPPSLPIYCQRLMQLYAREMFDFFPTVSVALRWKLNQSPPAATRGKREKREKQFATN